MIIDLVKILNRESHIDVGFVRRRRIDPTCDWKVQVSFPPCGSRSHVQLDDSRSPMGGRVRVRGIRIDILLFDTPSAGKNYLDRK